MESTTRRELRPPCADGFLLLHERADGLYVTVFPPLGEGRTVTSGDLRSRLAEFGVSDLDPAEIGEAVRRADGTPRRIGRFAGEHELLLPPAGGSLEVRLSEDRMRASLTFIPDAEEEGEAALERIEGALAAAGVSHGIDRELLGRVARAETPAWDLTVAEGAPGEPGRDGRLDFRFDPAPDSTPRLLADGRVDYRERGLIQNVAIGAVLIVVVPETPGFPCVRVDGSLLLPPPGAPAPPVRAGEGVKVLADGRTFAAQTDGHVFFRDGVLRVEPVYLVDGDVDYATGNLRMEGSILVRGTVRSGFTVRARGDIEIQGTVEAASVISEGGSVWIHGGVAGGDRAMIGARREIAARFLERATVLAGGTVSVHDAILDSRVSAGGDVRALAGRGQIFGGLVRAEGKIRAKILGAASGPATEIRIEPIEAPRLYARGAEAERILETSRAERERLDVLLTRYPRDCPSSERALAAIRAALEETDRRRRRAMAERGEIERRLAGSGTGEIEAAEAVHENCHVAIGRSAFRVRHARGPTRFVREGEILRWK